MSNRDLLAENMMVSNIKQQRDIEILNSMEVSAKVLNQEDDKKLMMSNRELLAEKMAQLKANQQIEGEIINLVGSLHAVGGQEDKIRYLLEQSSEFHKVNMKLIPEIVELQIQPN